MFIPSKIYIPFQGSIAFDTLNRILALNCFNMRFVYPRKGNKVG